MRPNAISVTEDDATPGVHYVAVLEDSPTSESSPVRSTMPMLASSPRVLQFDTPPTGAIPQIDELSVTESNREEPAVPLSPRLPRWWRDLHIRLSRNAAMIPIPLRSAALQVTWGDVVFTVPAVEALLLAAALLIYRSDIAESGIPPTIALILVSLFSLRNHSMLLWLTGLSLKRAVGYQQLFICIAALLGALHGAAYLMSRGLYENPRAAITGVVILAATVFICILSLCGIRQRRFGIFVWLQWIALAVVFAAVIVHGGRFAAAGLLPWIIDILASMSHRIRRSVRPPEPKTLQANAAADSYASIADVTAESMDIAPRSQLSVCELPGNITRIEFPKVQADTGEEFEYLAGQYALICIPKLSPNEWHPFSISSSPDEELVTFHIKAQGDWTQKLLEAASTAIPSNTAPFEVLVDGPYGDISIDIYSPNAYSHFVLLAGGIGVTPMRSIANWLHSECYDRHRSLIERVHFAWSVKDRATIDAIVGLESAERSRPPNEEPELSPVNEEEAYSPRNRFCFEFYVTQDAPDGDEHSGRHLRSCLQYGTRPDITAILHNMGKQAKLGDKTHVAVLVCGPVSMVNEVIAVSALLSRQMGIAFDVHNESFLF